MKISLLKWWVIWRRVRRVLSSSGAESGHEETQIDALMRRASPFVNWSERANWMIEVSEWLRQAPSNSSIDDPRHDRMHLLLDWLDQHRNIRRLVQATLQKTLCEALGPDLFCATGLPSEPAFFGELSDRVAKRLLPVSPLNADLPALFTAMFPRKADAEWLFQIDSNNVARLWRLCADDGIAHNFHQQIDDALTYLAAMVIAVGIGPEVRQRLEPKMPLQASPFMALQRELQKYLLAPPCDQTTLRSVRMLIAVCQAQTDRIYEHLDEHGVSVGLVYRIERMRAQLTRMLLLVDLRSAMQDEQIMMEPLQTLLKDLIDAHRYRSSIKDLVSRSFSLRTRKMVERSANHGEPYHATNREEYRSLLMAGCRGGAIAAFIVIGNLLVAALDIESARFVEGILVSLNFAFGFLAISAIGGVLAARQPAVTSSAMAAKMPQLDTANGIQTILSEITSQTRAQIVTIFGNLLTVIPVLTGLLFLAWSAFGRPGLPQVQMPIEELSIWGATPLYAAFTGILLWLAGLAGGFADNWFALRKMRDSFAHHRRLVNLPVLLCRAAYFPVSCQAYRHSYVCARKAFSRAEAGDKKSHVLEIKLVSHECRARLPRGLATGLNVELRGFGAPRQRKALANSGSRSM